MYGEYLTYLNVVLICPVLLLLLFKRNQSTILVSEWMMYILTLINFCCAFYAQFNPINDFKIYSWVLWLITMNINFFISRFLTKIA
jgi:hypothetical protein